MQIDYCKCVRGLLMVRFWRNPERTACGVWEECSRCGHFVHRTWGDEGVDQEVELSRPDLIEITEAEFLPIAEFQCLGDQSAGLRN
jgi:hypothetical protein